MKLTMMYLFLEDELFGLGLVTVFFAEFFLLVSKDLLFFQRLFFLKHLGPMSSLESRLEIVM